MTFNRIEGLSEFYLTFGEGVEVKGDLSVKQGSNGEKKQYLRFEFSNDKILEIEDVNIPTCKCMYIIQGSGLEDLLLLVGDSLFHLSSLGETVCVLKLNREERDEKFWSTHLERTHIGTLVIYEGGLFLVGNDLTLKWHRMKYYNDIFSGINEGEVILAQDHDVIWSVNLRNGK